MTPDRIFLMMAKEMQKFKMTSLSVFLEASTGQLTLSVKKEGRVIQYGFCDYSWAFDLLRPII